MIGVRGNLELIEGAFTTDARASAEVPTRQVGGVRNVERRPRRLRRGWHNLAMSTLLLSLLFAAPWLAAIAWVWSRAPKLEGPAPSLADRARERLWAA
jgi:hypothetical protein